MSASSSAIDVGVATAAPVLPGVNVLSEAFGLGFNTTRPTLQNVVDIEADVDVFLALVLPFIFLWLLGIGFVSYATDDDGYLSGARSVCGHFPAFRFVNQVLVYLMEMGQIMGLVFCRAATRQLQSGDNIFNAANDYLWNGNFKTAFPIAVTIDILMMILMIIPTILWFTLKRSTFQEFSKWYRQGALGAIISFAQDLFMIWLTIPIKVQLLRSVPCEYYLTGEQPIAKALSREGDEVTECLGSVHQQYLITGAIVAGVAFIVGVTAGTVPELVKRHTDCALNGRYISVSYAIKMMMVVVYVVAGDNHPYYFLSSTLFLQMLLVFCSISMRPCLVERVNYHRTCAYCLTIIPTVMCLVATGLDDPVAVLPFATGFTFLALAIVLIIGKYYGMVSGKLLPEMPFEEGAYKGDIVLGWNLPHGQGTLDFDESKFTGKFIYGKYNGYGVNIAVSEEAFSETYIKERQHHGDNRDEEEIRQETARQFFNGMHKNGKRDGFGTTNIMPNEGELSYEGFWKDDLYNGEGTKKFDNGDEFRGTFVDDIEDGEGVWTFETSIGTHKVTGLWDKGIYTKVGLNQDEVYEGDLRYGVPHGEGKLTIGDIIFEGEWRAGLMHGLGTVESPEGTYDGYFFEGEYHDQGTWTDEVCVYSGKFKNSLKHGHGREETEEGVYEGMFENGERNGYGTFTYANGAVYQGSWKEGEYSGAGFLKTDEFEFDGCWLNGKRHGGRGHIEYTNGEQYLGGWSHDMFQDNGVLRLPGLGEFHGTFDNGNKVGLGRFNFLDGSEYVGNWEDDRAHGDGKLVFSSRKAVYLLNSMDPDDERVGVRAERYFLDFGGTYTGNFDGGEMFGEGAVVTGDGTVYEGEWEQSVPHGQGELTYPGGGCYVGGWKEGHRDGEGLMEYVDNRCYDGEWREGRRHGHGVLRAPNGDILHDGDWLNDVPVEATKITVDVEIPVVDADEFLQAIMPAASSATEIEEGRMRKRLELEEIHSRILINIILEEELATTRIAKSFFLGLHNITRFDIIQEEVTLSRAMQKSTLAKVLNVFKSVFKYEHDREPKKSDLVNNRMIAPIYRRYEELKKM